MSLKNYLRIGIFTSLFLALWMVAGIVFISRATNLANEVLVARNEVSKIVTNLQDTSTYLTSEARLYTYTNNSTHLQRYQATTQQHLFTQAKEDLLKLNVPEDIANLIDVIDAASDAARTQEAEAITLVAQSKLLAAQASLMTDQYESLIMQVDRAYADFKTQIDLWSETEEKEGREATQIAIMVVSGLIFIFIVAVISILFVFRRKVKPLFHLTENAQQIAQGNLTVDTIEVRSKDEIAQLTVSFNMMTEKLRNILMTVKDSSINVAASAEELLASAKQTAYISDDVAASSERISTKASQQQLQMDENASALNEMTIGIQQVAASAEDVAVGSSIAKDRALDGQAQLQATAMQMQEIKDAVSETLDTVQGLSKQSVQIEEFVTAITDISAETNLLALNAAIEAARAGEAGKGFAVVADEVRKLAEQSNQSAGRITDIIQALQLKVKETATAMQHVTARVDDGVTAVEQTSRSFESIMDSTTNVSDQIAGVLAIAEQMAASAEQMTAIFENLHALADETATDSATSVQLVAAQHAAVQDITSSANMLATLADTLKHEVSTFKLDENKAEAAIVEEELQEA